MELNNVYNMDCIEGMKYIKSESVDLIVTDPPYDVDYNKKSEYLGKLGKSRDKQIERDATFIDKIPSYEEIAKEFYRILKNNTHCFIFCGDRQLVPWITTLKEAGFKDPQVLVWKKDITTFDMTMGHKFPENKEFILFFQKGWKKLNGYSIERKRFRSCLSFKSTGNTHLHSCAKPIELVSFLIKVSSNENDVIFDAFMGSGTTAIAARGLNRAFLGFEISKEYIKTIQTQLRQKTIKEWAELK